MARQHRARLTMSQSTMDDDSVAPNSIMHAFLGEGTPFKAGLVGPDSGPVFFANEFGPQYLGDDIADNITTTTTLAIGGSLSSSIQTSGDLDYIRVSLVAGQAYTFSLTAGAVGGIQDAYVELRDSAGNLIAQDDDSGILLNSHLVYHATQTGTFYVVARGFDGSSTGTYTLTANAIPQGNTSPTNFTPNALPFFSWDEAAIQITRSGASWAPTFGAATVVTYSYRSAAPTTMPDDTAGFTRFNAAQIAAAEAAFAAWAAVANITFVRVDDGDGYSNNATIVLGNYATGAAGAAAFAFLPSSGNTASSSVQGDVWINSSIGYNSNPVLGDYGPLVLLHEIGHALGLSHPADYNAGPGVTIEYGTHAIYYQDSRMFTGMSYFASVSTGGNLAAFAALPQLHDIAAIQRLYGANLASRTGDTIYGFNSNTSVPQYTLALATSGAVFAIWDGGGIDTLDLSGYSTASTIDLRQEAFSSAGPANGGLAIFNISIARGAIIENAVGGSGADTLIGNDAANRLTGNAGGDAITGGFGIDTSVYSIASTSASWMRNPNGSWTVTAGANGTDTVVQVERLDFTDRDVVLDNAQQTFSGNGTSDILWRNSVSGAAAIWEMLGTTQISATIAGGAPSQWALIGSGDWNADGNDDMLWRNTSDGGIAAWLQNGAASLAQSMIGGAPLNWEVAGIGDFNFDGRDDLVWRNSSDGGVAVWLQSGLVSLSQSMIGGAPLDWNIVAVADFDGDGRDDILWRRDDGQLARWTTDGTGPGQTSAAIIASVPTEWVVAGTGDFDGDGRDDILWRNNNDGAMSIWRMNGASTLQVAGIGSTPLTWNIADVGDYNGDGRSDILLRHDDGTIAFWLMDGLSLGSATIYGVVPTEWGII